jgi:hypothetical protein
MAAIIPKSRRPVGGSQDNHWAGYTFELAHARQIIDATNSSGRLNIKPTAQKVRKLCEALQMLSHELTQKRDLTENELTPSQQRDFLKMLKEAADRMSSILEMMGEQSHIILFEHGAFLHADGTRNYMGSRALSNQTQALASTAAIALRALKGLRPQKEALRNYAIRELARIYKEIFRRNAKISLTRTTPFEKFAREAMRLLGFARTKTIAFRDALK